MASRPNYVLAVLFVVYIFNFVDRQILSVLIVPIKAELGVSDASMGLLTGLTFALFYTTAGIPIARLADRGSRTLIISVGLVVWSAMTAASGLARGYWQLAACRVLVGVGEASASPASHSMISDYFPPERRATALSIYTMGANVGILLGLAGGGWIGQTFGWRNAFLIVGLPGLLMAAIVRFTGREPPRGRADGIAEASESLPTLREVLRYLFSLASFRQLSFAAGLYAFSGYGFMTWLATFLVRVHGLDLAQAGLYSGLLVGGGGALGAFVGGRLCDVLGRRDPRWQMWVAALGGVLAFPLAAGFVLFEDLGWALLCGAPALVFDSFYIGPTFALTQALARLRMRALAAAIILFVLNIIGLGLGPWLVGIANDWLAPSYGDHAIRYSLLAAAFVNWWAAAHSVWGARRLRRDLERVDTA